MMIDEETNYYVIAQWGIAGRLAELHYARLVFDDIKGDNRPCLLLKRLVLDDGKVKIIHLDGWKDEQVDGATIMQRAGLLG